jgi:hypothetical protein
MAENRLGVSTAPIKSDASCATHQQQEMMPDSNAGSLIPRPQVFPSLSAEPEGRDMCRQTDTVLHQARDDDAGIGQERVEIGATAGAKGEHLAGRSVPDRTRSSP